MGDFLLFFAGVREMFGSDVIVVKYDGDGAITVCDGEWSQGLVPTEGVSGSIDVEKFGFGVTAYICIVICPFPFFRCSGLLTYDKVSGGGFFLPFANSPVGDESHDEAGYDDCV